MREDIANQISEARQHKGLSLETLAESAQLNLSELRELEAGNTDQMLEWPLRSYAL